MTLSAGVIAATSGCRLDRAARWSTMRQVLACIAKFADVRCDGVSTQAQRIGYLGFGPTFMPKADQ